MKTHPGILKARTLRAKELEALPEGQPEDHKLIPLLHGHFAKVDNAMFDSIAKHLWYRSALGYAVRMEGRRMVWMHRIVAKTKDGLQTDHRNGDRLDNRSQNLRQCTAQQNAGNRWKSKSGKTSKFKGVYFCKTNQIFAAYGREGKTNRRLGSFRDEVEAAKAYNRWALGYFGEFATLNPV